ncbi:MAG: CsbD family protein [Maricaulaceae bacterium]
MDDVFKGQWMQLKGRVKSAWGKLTDDDVQQIEGDFDKFVGVLQERYGWEKAEAEAQARKWYDTAA